MGFFLPEIPQKRRTVSPDNLLVALRLPFNFVYSPGDKIRQYKKTDKSDELPCPPLQHKKAGKRGNGADAGW